MFILRMGKEDIDLGPVHPQDCDNCKKEQPFRLRLLYRYEHLFVVLGNTRSKSYVLVCENCQTAFRIPTATALKLARLQREPIPVLRRYGCLIVFALVVIILTVGLLLNR